MKHPVSKQRFQRISKNNFQKQLAKYKVRERFIRRLYANIVNVKPEIASADIERRVHQTDDPQPMKTERRSKRKPNTDEPLPYTKPEDHHHFTQSQRDVAELDTWLYVLGGRYSALNVCSLKLLNNFHHLVLSSCSSPWFFRTS